MIGVMEDVGTPREAPAGAGIGRSPLSRYARWQLRDFVRQRAGIMLLVAGLMSYPLFITDFAGKPLDPRFLLELRQNLVYIISGVMVTLGTIMATHGIVSEDRAQGYHRFLFAKPVSLLRYYAQSIGIQFFGVMATLSLVVGLYALLVGPVQVAAVLATSAVVFTLYGGVAFLFSTVTRKEYQWTLVTAALAAITQVAVREWGYTALAPLKWILPPLESIGQMIGYFSVDQPAAALASAIWPVVYGAGAFVAGLFVLRRRSLSS